MATDHRWSDRHLNRGHRWLDLPTKLVNEPICLSFTECFSEPFTIPKLEWVGFAQPIEFSVVKQLSIA